MFVVILFWLCTLGSVALSVVGVSVRSRAALVISGFLAMPLALYFAGTPRFAWLGLLLPLPQLLASAVIQRSRPLAIALASVFPCFVVWLEATVLPSNPVAIP
jgi:hypothetical protein